MEHKNAFLRFYLLVISIVATLGMVISFGFLAYNILDKSLISDEEYAKNNRRYTNCSSTDYYYDKYYDRDTLVQPTEEEIATCRTQVMEEVIVERAYSHKDGLISCLTRLAVFVILFASHFPFFIKQNREKK